MNRISRTNILLAVFIFPLFFTFPAAAFSQAVVYPTFSIQSVAADASVTIRAFNFPAGETFDVLMGSMGTRAVSGTWSASISSGRGGSFTATFTIPSALRGRYQIAIRLQSTSGSDYYAYNWFYNNTTGSNWDGGYVPASLRPVYFPSFSISAVQRDNSVTIHAINLPASERFRVMMGPIGTQAINGIIVASFKTGSGGSQSFTFAVPTPLYGSHRIAIRIESATGSGYFAYNWFYNNSTY